MVFFGTPIIFFKIRYLNIGLLIYLFIYLINQSIFCRITNFGAF